MNYFHCTSCQKRCTKVGESKATFGEPSIPSVACYKCEDHGYHVFDVEKNAVYGDSGRPDWNFERVQSKTNIEWAWIEP
jgi:hypothetical protein